MSAPYVPAGVPAGGTSSQVLAKASNAGYDVHWITPAAGGGGTPGGTSGQLQFNNAGAFAGAGVNWDAVNSRVGVGVANPSYPFQVNSAAGLVLAADCEATYHATLAPAYGFVGATSPDSVFYNSSASGMVAIQSGEPGGVRITATAGTGDVALQSAAGSLTVRHDGIVTTTGAVRAGYSVQAGGTLQAKGNTYSELSGPGMEVYYAPGSNSGGFTAFDRTAGTYLPIVGDATSHHWKLSGGPGMDLVAGPALGIGTAAPQGVLHINGGPLLVGAGSSTGAERVQGKFLGAWADNTDATRKGRVALAAGDWTGTDREGVRVESDGTQPLVGFYGAAAVARPSGDVLAALAALGLVGSPTLSGSDLPGSAVQNVTLNTGGVVHQTPVTFTVGGGTATGTLVYNTQAANRFYAGPATGAAAAPTFRALAAADLPTTGLRIDAHYATITADADAATVAFDLSLTNWHTVTLGGNRTLTLNNMTDGQVAYLELVQDATGGRTVTWSNTIRWSGGTAPTLATGANRADLVAIVRRYDGTYAGGMTLSNY